MAEIKTSFQCRNCSLHQNIFNHLNDRELELIDRQRYEVTFKEGETIFKQGAVLTHVACITRGMVKVYIEGLNNRNLLIKIVKNNELIGGPGMFTDFRHHFTVSALTKVTTCFIDVTAFNDVISTNPGFAIELLRINNIQGLNNFQKFINLTQKHMPGRIADALLYLADVVHESDSFESPISRQDLAEMTAMTKESAIRILKDLKDAGTITLDSNKFNILDKQALRKISLTG